MILLMLLVLSASEVCSGFSSNDHYLLSCGTSFSSADDGRFGSRIWFSDENTTFSPFPSFATTIPALPKQDSTVQSGPLRSARIFKSNFTYTFPVSPGVKLLRLYFYPTLYSHQLDASKFFISVQANNHLLLRNYSAQLAVNYALLEYPKNTDPFVVKEYYIPVAAGEISLNLTFWPTATSPYAFVNGIEVVSVPDGLYVTDKSIKNVQSQTDFQIQKTTSLQTAYRLNVGGTDVQDNVCITNMYRKWRRDDPYLYFITGITGVTQYPIIYSMVPNYTAPGSVYQTERHLGINPVSNDKLNLTWRFKVDPGFYYMVRFHWCENDFHINTTGDRVFEVYVNNYMAEDDADVMLWTNNHRYVALFKDYVLYLEDGNEDLSIVLRPSIHYKPSYYEVLLNGLEIFKINNQSDGSLNAPNPRVPLDTNPFQQAPNIEPTKRTHLLLGIIGGVVASILLITLLLFIFRRLKAKKESSTYATSTGKSAWIVPSFQSGSKTTASERGSTLPSHLCHRFSISEIRLATNDFSEGLIIGHGGFGNVYKGMVDREGGSVAIAIKRLNASSKQGVHEFVTEIELLSKLRHVHLVSLIGFCEEGREMILVYEYMGRGTLRDHLYNTDKLPLSWIQRLSICLGAAKGLHYLHSGASHMIIHRDVKSTNILLDDKWVSKVSDFGLSKLGPMGGDLSHVSTAVKGSIGYLDLEYYKSQQLTEKSDVYSFGVVLFEVLCARPAVDPNLPKEQVNLAKWARSHQRVETLDVIVDPKIKNEIAPACLNKFGEIAASCVSDRGHDRPSMADVVWNIEFVLDLQLRADENTTNCNDIILPCDTIDTEATVTANTINTSPVTTADGFYFSTTSGEYMTTTGTSSALSLLDGEPLSTTVFSEIHEPRGR